MTPTTFPWHQGPATAEWDLHLQAANEAKLAAAINKLGTRWVLAKTRNLSPSFFWQRRPQTDMGTTAADVGKCGGGFAP